MTVNSEIIEESAYEDTVKGGNEAIKMNIRKSIDIPVMKENLEPSCANGLQGSVSLGWTTRTELCSSVREVKKLEKLII